MSEHWAAKYIGTPWAFGAQGPQAFDCYSFTKHVQREHFGVEMLDVEYDRSNWREGAEHLRQGDEKSRWTEVTDPTEGDVILMGRNRMPIHIGVWIRANHTVGALHCLDRVGVVFQTRDMLRKTGWGSLTFYRHTK